MSEECTLSRDESKCQTCIQGGSFLELSQLSRMQVWHLGSTLEEVILSEHIYLIRSLIQSLNSLFFKVNTEAKAEPLYRNIGILKNNIFFQ